MSYGLRGYDGRVHGLGVFNPPGQPDYEDCDPRDTPCVMRNSAKSNANVLAIAGAQAQNNLDQCLANAENANSPEQKASVLASCGQAYSDAGAYAAQTAAAPVTWYSGGGTAASFVGVNVPVKAPAPPVARGGQLTFTSSRGGTALQVGDTWMVAITGASPNSPVTVSGSMPGSSFSGTAMGTTDSNGNFSKSGQVGTGEIGSWQESWAVGGAPSGSFSFTVVAAPAQQVIFKQAGAAANGAAAGGGSADGGSTPGGSTVAGFDLSKIPWWGWLAAGGVALFAFKGGR
jgi:hypothetical protein